MRQGTLPSSRQGTADLVHIDFIVEAAAPADGGGGGGGGGDATSQRAALESLRGAMES